MTLIEQRDIIQAAIDKKTIQYRPLESEVWRDLESVPHFNFLFREYRVKPEPRELWINFYESSEMIGYVYGTEQAANANAAMSPVKKRKCLHVQVLD